MILWHRTTQIGLQDPVLGVPASVLTTQEKTLQLVLKFVDYPSFLFHKDRSTGPLRFLGNFLLTGKVTNVGSIGRLREENSSFRNRLPAEFTKCSLHTRVLLFTGNFFRPILYIHTLSCLLLFNGSR